MDPYYGDNKAKEEPEAMDLPDDLNLDGDDEDEGNKQGVCSRIVEKCGLILLKVQ